MPQKPLKDQKRLLHLAAIIDSSDDAIISKNLDGIIQSWSKGAERIFGYSEIEAVGQHISLIIPEYLLHEEKTIINRLKQKQRIDHFQTKRKAKNGKLIDVSVSISPLIDEQGAVIGAAKIIRDMSTVKEEQKLRAVLESAPDAFVIVNDQGKIIIVNDQTEKLFGYSRDELLGQPIEVLVPERLQAHYLKCHNNCMSSSQRAPISNLELYGIRKNRTEFPIEISLSPVKTEEGLWTSSSIRDITEKKKLADDLIRNNESLQRSNQDLEAFAYAASHDLKAPLRVIDNASKWLEEDLKDQLSGENLENMALLRGRVKRMEKLLDDLLAYSRAGRVNDKNYNESVSGQELIDDIFTLLPPPDNFKISIDKNFLAARFNRMPLKQIILNLINNAIKHHDSESGHIQIDLKNEAENYIIAVSDDGPGIAPEYHDEVFKMLRTLKPRDQVEGSGMGLTMVKKYIDLYNGSIHIEANQPHGATFVLKWPKEQKIKEGHA